MKNKIFVTLVMVITIFFGFGKVYANELVGLKNIEYTKDGGFEKVKLSFSDSIGEVSPKKFDNPDRIVVDFFGCELRLKNANVNVGSDQIIRIRSGQFMPTVARIVLDLKKSVKYSVTKNGKYYIISIPIGEAKEEEKKKEEVVSDKNKVETKEEKKKEEVVSDKNKVETKEEKKKEEVVSDKNKVETKEEKKKEEVVSDKNKVETKEEKKKEEVVSDKNKVETKEEIKKLNKVFVEYKKQGEYEVTRIKVNSYKGYNAFRLNNPDRIVVDIPNGCFEEGSNNIRVDGKFIKSIRSNNFTKNVARVILDVLMTPSYEILEEKDGLKILVKSAGDNNKKDVPGKVQYILAGDRVCLKINKLGFTNNEGLNISNYTERYDKKNKTYAIIFDKDIANLKNEVLKIDDNYIDRIEILNRKQKTKIVFFAKDNFLYEVISRKKANDTVILILKKATKKKSIVVIDAGHGGVQDPGAVCNLINEKCLNLDIALRVEECLKKKGISTYMTRKSDLYLSGYERANIANRLNASLFLSIHNNTYEGQARGTETLYNPNNSDESISIRSKKFATIMQNKIVKKIGTVDRGIKKRPNLVVLKNTNMPGVLVEVAFLTNPDEFKLLNDCSFRQKVAESIADGIEEMLKAEGKL